jgi:hypothetical protein
MYLEAPGQSILVINDISIAQDLLEKRSTLYSSRYVGQSNIGQELTDTTTIDLTFLCLPTCTSLLITHEFKS